MNILNLGFACDHAGFETKQKLIEHFTAKGYTCKDYGAYSTDSVDYSDFAHPLAKAVTNKEHDFGVTLCGSGNGISMTANKHREIRAALCWTSEIAELARLHNDANVCSIPARFVSIEEAIAIVEIFLATGFEGGRHIRRIEKMKDVD